MNGGIRDLFGRKGGMMRKRACPALLAAVAAFFLLTVSARGELSGFGIKVGLARANIFGGGIFDQRYRTGFAGGAFITWDLGPRFALQPEILWVRKGSTVSDASGLESYRETLSLDYLEIPILAKFRFPLIAAVRYHVFTGPSPAFRLKAGVKVEHGGVTEIEIPKGIRKTDLGWIAGAGVEVPAGGIRISLDLRAAWGLMSLAAESAYRIRNRAICVFIGAAF